MMKHPFRKFEDVIVTELIDGIACVFANGEKDETSPKTAAQNPWITDFCKRNPTAVVKGVAYGREISRKDYGTVKGQMKLAVFDIMVEGKPLSQREARIMGHDLFWVPTIAIGHFSEAWLTFNTGPTHVPGATHPKAGCVIRPQVDRAEDGKRVMMIIKNEKP